MIAHDEATHAQHDELLEHAVPGNTDARDIGSGTPDADHVLPAAGGLLPPADHDDVCRAQRLFMTASERTRLVGDRAFRVTGELVATPTWIAEVLLWAAASCAETLADGTRRHQLYLRGGRGGSGDITRGRVKRLRLHASEAAVRAGALVTAFDEWIAHAAAAVNIEMNYVAAAPVAVDDNVLLLWGGKRPQVTNDCCARFVVRASSRASG